MIAKTCSCESECGDMEVEAWIKRVSWKARFLASHRRVRNKKLETDSICPFGTVHFRLVSPTWDQGLSHKTCFEQKGPFTPETCFITQTPGLKKQC